MPNLLIALSNTAGDLCLEVQHMQKLSLLPLKLYSGRTFS